MYKPFYLEDKSYKWTITNESKIISGLTCYMATAEEKITYKDKSFSFPIIVWFTPDISFPYGPAKFFGLPGIILEAHYKGTVFGASKIELNSNNKGKFNTINTSLPIISEAESIKRSK